MSQTRGASGSGRPMRDSCTTLMGKRRNRHCETVFKNSISITGKESDLFIENNQSNASFIEACQPMFGWQTDAPCLNALLQKPF